MNASEKYAEFKAHVAKVTDLSHAESVLSWDQQTHMPKNGGEVRAQLMTTLKSIAHEMFVAPKFGDLLQSLKEEKNLSADERKNVELVHRDYLRKKKYPQEFVDAYSRVCADAFMAWAEAKKTQNFSIFEPALTKIVEFKRQEAEFLGYAEHPYEALMEDFERGLTVKKIDEVFKDVNEQLFPFIKKIKDKGQKVSPLLSQNFPAEAQQRVTKELIQKMGYSYEGGRSDMAPHPFCTTFGPGDVRITLWVDEQFLPAMIFAGIHESGHALYEMGLPQKEQYGLPLGSAISMAFHESQSRLWENMIGRSRPYWKANFPLLMKNFPEQFKGVNADEFYKAINHVAPSFVRVEADELTYHGHIYIRYLIEKALIEGSLQVKDVPEFWNSKYEQVLGIRPANDAEGCLQDVHWCYGAFGYFPTYSLGSFYSAQLMAQMKKENPKFDSLVESGDTSHALKWLRENVHAHGQKYTSGELLTKITGSDLKFSYFMDYAKAKYGELYGV